MIPIEQQLAEGLRAAASVVLDRPWTGPVAVEVSNRPDLADYASPLAFAMARDARRPPLEIAQRIAEAAQDTLRDIATEVTASPPAFVNLRIDTKVLGQVVDLAHAADGAIADSDRGADEKVVLEHTNINPNKAAHLGHFRNACLGDSLARLLARQGHPVEVQNYIDDTGVQVADVVVGLRFLDLDPQGDRPFDRYCSDVYVQVQQAYEARPELAERREEIQRAIEAGEGELAAFARDVTRRVAVENLRTMTRAGVGYDLLTWESDILALGFWQTTFQVLRDKGAVHLEEDGPNAGCWVLPFGLGTVETEGKVVTEDKVLVTGRGIATYTAKDLAYQMWKFGLLGQDFRYAPFPFDVGQGERPLWSTASSDGEAVHPEFAGADRVVNVIDASQSYPQQVVYEALRRVGYDDAAEHSEHLSYGYVSLTPDAARALGAAVDEGATKVAMSGRAGLQVFADDLLDELTALAAERSGDEQASSIAVGAARYYMLKYSNNQEILFDFEEALRTTGETGVYLQYAYVRASSILRKVGDAPPAPPVAPMPDLDRALVLKMADYPRVMSAAADDRSVATVAKYAFDLCSAFNSFYDNTEPIVREADGNLKAWRGGMVAAFRAVLGDAMDVLGIPPLARI